MSTPEYDTFQLVGRHVPDEASGPYNSMQEAMADGHDTLNPVTGKYQFGALVDGVFVVLIEEKASLIFDAIELGRQQQPQQQPQAEQPSQGEQQPETGPQSPAGAEPVQPQG